MVCSPPVLSIKLNIVPVSSENFLDLYVLKVFDCNNNKSDEEMYCRRVILWVLIVCPKKGFDLE